MAKDKNKNVIEEALSEIETIQEALKSNAGEIFRTVAKEEIEELMEGRLYEDDDEFEEEEISDEDSNEETSEDDNEEDSLDIDLDGTEGSDEETDTEINLGDDMEGDLESQDDTELDINLDTEDEIDLTGATEDEVIKVYKRLRDNDEIDIVSDNEVKLTDDESGNEYSIKTDSNEMNESNDETVYRITLDEDYHTEDMDETQCETEDETEEDVVLEIELDDEELEENLGTTRGYAGRQGAKKTGSAHHPKRRDESKKETKHTVSESEYKNKYEKLINEFNNLKTENKQFKNLLKTFKTKLAETAVFNTNLAHATKLFVEHTTNKAEKETILKRFDEEANTIEESKKLFKSIVNDLDSKKTMTESLDEKMVSKQQKVSSDKNINEQTAYVDPEIQNILGLMDKIN